MSKCVSRHFKITAVIMFSLHSDIRLDFDGMGNDSTFVPVSHDDFEV